MSYGIIHVSTPIPLKEKIEFLNLPEGSMILGIKIIDNFLVHEIRCKLENFQDTKTVILETLEKYHKNDLLKQYKIY